MAMNEDQLMGSPSIFWIFLSLNVFSFCKILSLNTCSFYATKNNYKKAEKAKICKTLIIDFRP